MQVRKTSKYNRSISTGEPSARGEPLALPSRREGASQSTADATQIYLN